VVGLKIAIEGDPTAQCGLPGGRYKEHQVSVTGIGTLRVVANPAQERTSPLRHPRVRARRQGPVRTGGHRLPQTREGMKRMTSKWLAAAAAILAIPLALAQGDYPNHPVTMVVPFPPGGVADITGRPAAEAMGRFLKQPVVVENKAGAGGGVGMAYVAKAKPDGYTVLLALSSISVIPEADKILAAIPCTGSSSSCRSRASRPIPPSSRFAPTARTRA
jgi:hypothetical protein